MLGSAESFMMSKAVNTLHEIWQLNYKVENQTSAKTSSIIPWGRLRMNRNTAFAESALVCE